MFQPEWCRLTLASIVDGVIVTDTHGRVTFLNAAAESLTGWAAQDASGEPLESVFKIVSEGTRGPVESPVQRAVSQGVVVGLGNHSVLIAKDGTERPIEDTAAPIRNDKGQVAGAVLVFRDTTQRKNAERQLKDALAYADSIIATLQGPFLVLDNALRVRTANIAFYRNFRVSPHEVEGRFVYELGDHEWDIPALRTLLEDVLPGNRAFHDYRVEHDFPSIGKRVMLLNAHRFEAVESRPELILLSIQDITEHWLAEGAVQRSEVRYRRLFETAKDGILILDADNGKIIDANPYMTKLLGYSHEEFMGKELWEIGLFSEQSENEAAFKTLQRDGYVRYEHLPLETSTGEEAQVEFVSNVYLVDDQSVAQCNIRDISERVRLERKTQDQSEELSDLHRSKDEFLAMLSHELRNPLAPLMNAVQLLRQQQGTESPIQWKARSIIERQLGQLKHLVDDLLEVSRINSGRVRLRQARVGVNGIVEAALETARPLINERKHEITVSEPAEPIWLYADPARLEQVLVNLLTNAAKYTDEGGHIWLTVELEGASCVLRVLDTGLGISPELLPRIFDLFTQAERSMDRSQGGLGIGLSLVQRLVELHGGTVEARSVVGQGSEFIVRLPAVSGPGARRPSPIMDPAVPPPPRVKVLVVDDSVDMAESLAMLVESSGHESRTVHDGPSTLQAAMDFLPNVVLLDIGLPGMNGYEVAKLLRKEPLLKDVILVASTGYGRESDRQASVDAGFDHHLVKPAEFSEVRRILAGAASKLK
ncbi:MAG TPA: PAS domain S-box protein [Gemmatimonadaceae bacterium]|nr:PAS domain S-box protein [Gemmatimonadaceae bacterium]